jgi:type IV pilus assembly protein PilB
VILTILEEYFEGNKKLGEILCDMGKLTPKELEKMLELQKKEGNKRRIGELLIQEGLVQEKDVQRALAVQNRPAE